MTTVREEFLFLNRLRESGKTNMWGASPYVAEMFDLPADEAKEVLGAWMRWISESPSRANL